MQLRKLPPRSQCLIVVNLPEAEATTTQTRLDHDLQLLRSQVVTHKLKGTPVQFLRDLDPDQRSKLKTVLEELRERREKGETDLCIRDFHVHRKRPQFR
ncbi:unnamed protein product [Echinostoma caproni]|uniref:RRM domain-containing protein n=1 Tax=Echinostoma caproni TaxID=27848 RepID=A0A183A020_9TREM|nr:unnamed protein product [Echinostoma caproni]